MDAMRTYLVQIGEEAFPVTPEDISQLDIVHGNSQQFHVLVNHQAFQVEVLDANFPEKQLTLHVNGQRYELRLEDEYDQLIKQLGLSGGNQQKVSNIMAPMPGLILEVLVEPGKEVVKGDPLVILEAMKMENVIKSEGEGVVKLVHVEKGMAVEKGHQLVEME